MPISLATGNKRHSQTERGADLYQTPPEAVHALLSVEPIPLTVWEPAAGPGSIVKTLRETGRAVIASDLHDWGCPDSQSGLNFLEATQAPPGIAAIITNPPFSLAGPFVRKALELCPLVMMLARLAFIESVGRTDIIDGGQLARIYPFANRLPMMHREGWDGPRSTSAMAFAWFIWDRDHEGPTQLKRLRWT